MYFGGPEIWKVLLFSPNIMHICGFNNLITSYMTILLIYCEILDVRSDLCTRKNCKRTS